MKSIYTAVLVHLYDTSTDIAILISWSILASDEISGKQNYENVNMLSFLIPSILLIFVYRIAFAMVHYNTFKNGTLYLRRDTILILSDLYIFLLVYYQFIEQYLSPCLMQKKLQTLESVFESMPQLVMQSIFLIRTYNTDLGESDSIYIVFASIFASLLSIVTKFLSNDQEWVIPDASSSHFSYKRCPCISLSYLSVILWRLCESIARFSIFTLLWAVLGGIYLPIYLLISIIIYYCLDRYTDFVWIVMRSDGNTNYYTSSPIYSRRSSFSTTSILIYTLQCVVGLPLKYHLIMNIIRFIDNCIILTVIYIFAFLKFDCILCYNKMERNAFNNPYILVLLSMASVATIIEFIVYLGLYSMQIVQKKQTPKIVEIIGMSDLDRIQLKQVTQHPLLCKFVKNRKKLDVKNAKTKNTVIATNGGDEDEEPAIQVLSKHKTIVDNMEINITDNIIIDDTASNDVDKQ